MSDQGDLRNVVPFDPNAQKAVEIERGVMLVAKWRRILAVRWLAFIALGVASAIWLMTAGDPLPWRFIAASGFSVGVLMPILVLYFMTCRAE